VVKSNCKETKKAGNLIAQIYQHTMWLYSNVF